MVDAHHQSNADANPRITDTTCALPLMLIASPLGRYLALSPWFSANPTVAGAVSGAATNIVSDVAACRVDVFDNSTISAIGARAPASAGAAGARIGGNAGRQAEMAVNSPVVNRTQFQWPALVEQIPAPVGSLSPVGDYVRVRHLRHLVREVGPVATPIPERAAMPRDFARVWVTQPVSPPCG